MKFISFLTAFLMSLSTLSISASANDLPSISAKGAVLIDPVTGEILYEKNARDKMPMASTTKIMSAMLAIENGNLDEEFTVDSQAIKVEGSSMGLKEGDRVTMRTLVYGMLLPSGNDAANAAAVRISGSVESFVQLMNDRAAELGMTATHFVTPSGLDDDTDEHYSTAYDMAILTKEALKNPDFRQICGTYNAKLKYGNPPYERWLTNSNKLLNTCEGVIGVKTGFTDKARRCLVSACEREGAVLICVTLNAPNDWLDHSRLYDYGFSMFEKQQLPLNSSKFAVNVVGGVKNSVACETKIPSLNLLRARAQQVECQVYINSFVYAPIAQGVQVGKIKYLINGEVIHEEPIIASQSVGYKKIQKRKGFVERCFSRIEQLF